MLIGPSVLVLVHVSRGGTRRPVAHGEAFELWDGVRLVAEFPTTLILDLLAGLIANLEMSDRVRQTMPAKRKPLAIVTPEKQTERQNARRKRS
jgi:hypothetical protein